MKERPTPETDIIAADDNPLFRPWRRRICAHARKLERQRDELLEALDACRTLLEVLPNEYVHKTSQEPLCYSPDGALGKARAAIAKVKGSK